MVRRPSYLKLKVFWVKNYLGLAINQVSLDKCYPLTPFYFWPKTQAWEQLKLKLDSKHWLATEEKIEILKVTGDVMNYWLSEKNSKKAKDLKEVFPEVDVFTL